MCYSGGGGFLTSIPLRASTSYGTRNFAANSTIRHVVPFSRTAKMALSGLLDRPERFSPSCSASTAGSAATPERTPEPSTVRVEGAGGRWTHICRISRNGVLMEGGGVEVGSEICSIGGKEKCPTVIVDVKGRKKK